ncbi:hypothetical protein P9112_000581 [Eukaryota sp. TZLM1-RC]
MSQYEIEQPKSDPHSPTQQSSVQSPDEDDAPFCRICRMPEGPLFALCQCKGSLQFLHIDCLSAWHGYSGSQDCELCNTPFRVASRPLPICQWKKMRLQQGEIGKIIGIFMSTSISMAFLIYTLLVIIGSIDIPFELRTAPLSAVILIIFELSVFFGLSVYGITFFAKLFLRWMNQNRYITVLPNEMSRSV